LVHPLGGVEVLFPASHGRDIGVIVADVLLLGAYLWLALMAAREQPA